MDLLEFELPDTGEGVTEGTFLEWLVDEGEEVDEDQTIAEVETDKAVVDVPAPSHGTVEELRAEPGDTVDVGEVILVMDDGESSSQESKEKNAEEKDVEDTESAEKDEDKEENIEKDTGGEKSVKEESEKDEQKSKSKDSSSVLALPKVRKLAEEKGIDISGVQGSRPDGRITEDDVLEHTESSGEERKTERDQVVAGDKEVQATPSVRKLARQEGIDISGIKGSGRGGKVTRDDVISASEGNSGEKTSKETEELTDLGEVERVEMTGVRKAIAERMEESRFTAPHVTHVEKADITELVELREEKKEEFEAHLTYLPFIMKSLVIGLKEYPDLNAELDEDAGEVVQKKYYDFNIAVDTDRGLMVPVIDDVDEKTIVELAEDIEEKAEKAIEGELSGQEMKGGTFSITNLGVIGGEEFTPIINYPQVAILGIGKIKKTPEVVEGEIIPRDTVKLSLSYDHRVVDGATAARFMNTVLENLEDPEKLLMAI